MGEVVPEVEELAVTKRDASSLTMDPCFWSTDECEIPEQEKQRVVAASSNEEIIGLQDVFDTKGLPCITIGDLACQTLCPRCQLNEQHQHTLASTHLHLTRSSRS